MSISEYIKNQRKAKGLSQQVVSEFLKCTRQTYTQIENGSRDISLGESKQLANLFGVSLEKFVTEKNGFEYDVEIPSKASVYVSEEKHRISVPQNKIEKFKEVLIYILEKVGSQANVGQTVIYKLLYFIDFDYYEKYEEQFIGARYQKNHFGPTPIEFKKITENMIRNNEIELVKSNYFKHDQTKYLPYRSANLELLTGREIKHIDEVLARLAQKNANELSEYSHQDIPWIMAEEGEEIQYEAVFYRTHETTVRNYE